MLYWLKSVPPTATLYGEEAIPFTASPNSEGRLPVVVGSSQFVDPEYPAVAEPFDGFKQWPGIFNNDSTLASAVLDRLLHHAETVVIEGPSYRMQERATE